MQIVAGGKGKTKSLNNKNEFYMMETKKNPDKMIIT